MHIGQLFSDLPLLLMRIPAMLLAISIHESAHAWAAWKLGDPTARNLGRITLNPLKHLDPIGALMMILFGFGWASPVPINSRYFKKPKRDMALSALAGPVSNLLLGFVGFLLLRILLGVLPDALWGSTFGYVLFLFLNVFYMLNVSLAVFNFLPVPPLDGSRILYVFLPARWYFGVMKYERWISLVILFLAFSGWLSVPLSWVVSRILYVFDFLTGWIPFLF